MLRLLALVLSLSAAASFSLTPLVGRATVRAASVTMSVEDAALACLEEECSLDTVTDLLKELKAEYNSQDSERQTVLRETIEQLEALNKFPIKNKSEIEKIVLGASRSFSVVDGFKFKGEPMGYTMKPGKSTTAGKALE